MRENLSRADPALSDEAGDERLYLMGNELRLMGEWDQAEVTLKEALQLAPDHFKALSSLAFLYRERGRTRDAETLLSEWMHKRPRDPQELTQVAGFLETIQAYVPALACLDEIIRQDPEAGRTWFIRGRLLLALGRIDAAIESFEHALEHERDLDHAYLELAHIRTFESSDPMIAFFKRAAQTPDLSESAAACIRFALGKICDDLGQSDEAVEWIEEANTLRRKTISSARTDCGQLLRARLETPRRVWQAASPAPTETPEPIFILGLPRSGTALLERLLIHHPAIVSAGELPTLPGLIQSTHLVQRWRTFEESHMPVPEEDLEALRETYREALQGASGALSGSVRYVIDSNPLNFFEVGIVRRLFPTAPIFALERDPRDVLISLYFHDFTHPDLAFSYSTDEIVSFIEAHQRIMLYWTTLPVPGMRTVRYETLVTEPAVMIRSLLGFLHLDPDSLPTPKDLAGRVIVSTTDWQGRQPVYGRSIGRWKHYAASLLARHPELSRIGFTA